MGRPAPYAKPIQPNWLDAACQPLSGGSFRRGHSLRFLQRTIPMIRKLLLALGVTSIAFTATACNTVKGLGRDIQSVGEAGEDALD